MVDHFDHRTKGTQSHDPEHDPSLNLRLTLVDIRFAIDVDIDRYFYPGSGLGLTHTEKLFIQKFKIARETSYLEAETDEGPKEPDIGRVVESYFNFPNEYSSSIILTDSDFVLSDRTCGVR